VSTLGSPRCELCECETEFADRAFQSEQAPRTLVDAKVKCGRRTVRAYQTSAYGSGRSLEHGKGLRTWDRWEDRQVPVNILREAGCAR